MKSFATESTALLKPPVKYQPNVGLNKNTWALVTEHLTDDELKRLNLELESYHSASYSDYLCFYIKKPWIDVFWPLYHCNFVRRDNSVGCEKYLGSILLFIVSIPYGCCGGVGACVCTVVAPVRAGWACYQDKKVCRFFPPEAPQRQSMDDGDEKKDEMVLIKGCRSERSEATVLKIY